jgi:hypothetical protein
MPKMSTLDLKAMLAAEKADALAAISAARLAEERADAMDYYLGHMAKDMPAQDGRSRAVSTDVADTIEGLAQNSVRPWLALDLRRNRQGVRGHTLRSASIFSRRSSKRPAGYHRQYQ